MFTGLVEELGRIDSISGDDDGARIRFACPKIAPEVRHGDSIAINGCCVTAVEPDQHGFGADIMHETLKRTNLGELVPGDPVNLERAMAVNARFGGHIVQGHIDGRAVVRTTSAKTNSRVLEIGLDPSLGRYLIAQGSVTVDGVSLTVVDVGADDASFSVSLIPTTLDDTALGTYSPGTAVNIEVDVLAKYVERLVSTEQQEGRS